MTTNFELGLRNLNHVSPSQSRLKTAVAFLERGAAVREGSVCGVAEERAKSLG